MIVMNGQLVGEMRTNINNLAPQDVENELVFEDDDDMGMG